MMYNISEEDDNTQKRTNNQEHKTKAKLSPTNKLDSLSSILLPNLR